MMEIDWSVGEILKALDQNHLTENTLVILTSDNGPWLTFGNYAGSTGGLREGKGTAWDGGLKVPCIMRWPGKIKAATVCNQLASTLDIMPTINNLCKTKSPDKTIDGVDISTLLLGEVSASPRKEFVYYYDKNNLKAIRYENWKLVFDCISQTYSRPENIGKDGFPGKYGTDTVKMALYNLTNDPGEDRDVKDKYPDVVDKLKAIAEKYRIALGDGLTNTTGTEIRPAAIIEEKK